MRGGRRGGRTSGRCSGRWQTPAVSNRPTVDRSVAASWTIGPPSAPWVRTGADRALRALQRPKRSRANVRSVHGRCPDAVAAPDGVARLPGVRRVGARRAHRLGARWGPLRRVSATAEASATMTDVGRDIEAMRAAGYGPAAIARALNARRVPTPSGRGQWWAGTVRQHADPAGWAAYMRLYRRTRTRRTRRA